MTLKSGYIIKVVRNSADPPKKYAAFYMFGSLSFAYTCIYLMNYWKDFPFLLLEVFIFNKI